MSRFLFVVCLSMVIAACQREETKSVEQFYLRPVILPDGTTVHAEVNTQKADMGRGMMFRDSFPEGRGMLFIHGTPGLYPYWMYQTKVPLDIIWMDRAGRVVEISENTPPCTTKASECPNYGGTKEATVVLELPGGSGRRHGVALGEVIRF